MEYKKQRNMRLTDSEYEYVKAMLAQFRVKTQEQKTKSSKSTGIESPKNLSEESQPLVVRQGLSVEEFLQKVGKSPQIILPEDESEPEVDYTEWNTDRTMCEIDRGCVYEMDGNGYPEEAERFASRYPDVWKRLFRAKQANQMARYNEIMYTEVWEIVKDGRF